jgi:hypothetical protein
VVLGEFLRTHYHPRNIEEIDAMMEITNTSMFTGEENTMHLDVTFEEILDWKGGTLIQNAMPRLDAGEREFMMTGVTPEEWDSTFHETDEEGGDE